VALKMSVVGEIQRRRYEYLINFIKEFKDCKILDLGCQSGELCNLISQSGNEVYGIDVMEELVKEARQKYPNIKFKSADLEKGIPFEDKYFDVVWAGEIIEHIHFTDVFVNEVNRILKIGGYFVLSTPMHNRLKSVLISLCRFEKHFDPELYHLRFYTINSLKNVLGKRGFKIEKVRHFGRIKPIANTMLVISRKQEDKKCITQIR
jgi:2-polyprenyl-3-methyl-5-hydroxy-6-metoxy-1,4-benzoquinol methylase